MSTQLEFKQRPKLFNVAVRMLNVVGAWCLGKSKEVPIPAAAKEILIGKCDHLGDLMMITDFLETLKRRFPEARITLICGVWSRGLVDRFVRTGMVNGVIQYSPFVLNRANESLPQKAWRAFSEFFSALRTLRKKNYDLYFDLRPFSGNTLLLARLAGVPCRIGFGGREFGFTLNYKNPYQDDATLGQMINSFSVFIGVSPRVYEGPRVPSAFFGEMLVYDRIKFTVLIHAISGNPRKNLPREDWPRVISVLNKASASCVWVGAKSDRKELENILSGAKGTHRIVCGSLDDTLRECAQADAAITVDSFVAHIVLAAKKPLMILGPGSLRDIVAQAVPMKAVEYAATEDNFPRMIDNFLNRRKG